MSEYLQIGVDDDKVNDYLVVSKSFHKNILDAELKNFIISINKYMNIWMEKGRVKQQI